MPLSSSTCLNFEWETPSIAKYCYGLQKIDATPPVGFSPSDCRDLTETDATKDPDCKRAAFGLSGLTLTLTSCGGRLYVTHGFQPRLVKFAGAFCGKAIGALPPFPGCLEDDLLSSTPARVFFNGNLSEPWTECAGFRQGSVLGPLLFNILFDGVAAAVRAACPGVALEGFLSFRMPMMW